MTLNLTDAEMQALKALSAQKKISKTALMPQVFRLYQAVDARVEAGHKLLFENKATRKKSELIIL